MLLRLLLAGVIVYTMSGTGETCLSPVVMGDCAVRWSIFGTGQFGDRAGLECNHHRSGRAGVPCGRNPYAAKQESLDRAENLWPLALLAVPWFRSAAGLLRALRWLIAALVLPVWRMDDVCD